MLSFTSIFLRLQMFSRDLNVRLSVVYAEIWLDVQRVDLFQDIERTMSGVVDYSTGHIYSIGKLF